MEQLLSMSPCPILRVRKDGKVLYANEASSFLMKLWDVRSGEKVPPEITEFVRKAIMQQSPCKLAIKEKTGEYFLIFSPTGEEYVNIYGLDPHCGDEVGIENCRLEKHQKKPPGLGKHFLSCNFSESPSDSDSSVSSFDSGNPSSPVSPDSSVSPLSSVSPDSSSSSSSICPGHPWEGEPEKALRMQKMLWTVINNSPAVVFFWRNEEKWPTEFVSENVAQFGYKVEDFISGNVLYGNIIHREDINRVCAELRRCIVEDCDDFKMEYRIFTKDRKLRWVDERTFIQRDSEGNVIHFQGVVVDITERKAAEEALKKAENLRKKEIHHRIKNNLQVISSLLDLQAEKFDDEKVIEAFRESESRVISISLIHEELYKSGDLETIDFSSYLRRLTEDLFQAYGVRDSGIRLHLDADSFFLGVDKAVSLGIIINEMLINSLKYAFPEGKLGEIRIALLKENPGSDDTPPGNLINNPSGTLSCNPSGNQTGNLASNPSNKLCVDESAGMNAGMDGTGSDGISPVAYEYFKLIYSDDGKGLPENIDFKNPDTLGLQLVNTLVEQIEGKLDMERDGGTKFTIRFRNKTL